jgi:hypothetical protein
LSGEARSGDWQPITLGDKGGLNHFKIQKNHHGQNGIDRNKSGYPIKRYRRLVSNFGRPDNQNFDRANFSDFTIYKTDLVMFHTATQSYDGKPVDMGCARIRIFRHVWRI